MDEVRWKILCVEDNLLKVKMNEVRWKILGVEDNLLKVKKIKTGYLYSGTVSFTATGGCRLFCSTLPVRHLQKLITG